MTTSSSAVFRCVINDVSSGSQKHHPGRIKKKPCKSSTVQHFNQLIGQINPESSRCWQSTDRFCLKSLIESQRTTTATRTHPSVCPLWRTARGTCCSLQSERAPEAVTEQYKCGCSVVFYQRVNWPVPSCRQSVLWGFSISANSPVHHCDTGFLL